MNSKREFLKTALAGIAGIALTKVGVVHASTSHGFPLGVVYTAKQPGRWAKKVGSHAPKVKVSGGNVEIATLHPMSEKHYIVRHTLVTKDGKVIGEKTFYPSDKRAVSNFKLPAEAGGDFYATSFCNLHDFWVTEFSI